MLDTIVTYETFHGSTKKVGKIIASKLECKLINIDTPFEIEDLSDINNIILVINLRGPYTAQLTKLYLNRVKSQLKLKNVYLIGVGLFSEKEFPQIADEINKKYLSKTFNKYFVKGQLRTKNLTPEEVTLLNNFSKSTKLAIHNMGKLDLQKAKEVSESISTIIKRDSFIKE